MSEPAAAPRPDRATPEPSAGAPAATPPVPRFTPVPVRPRRDGWTAQRQRVFIQTLAETGLVTRAARAAGMSERSAHRLALREDAESFCQAWDAALRLASRRGVSSLYEYALDGMTETVWRDGEVAYRRRRPSEKALIFLLSRLDPLRFGAVRAAPAAQHGTGDPVDERAEAAADFDLYLAGLEDLPPGDDDDDDDRDDGDDGDDGNDAGDTGE